MKKTILTLALAMGLITAVSAQTKVEQSKTDHHEQLEKATYACPMKCEAEKKYEAAGKCPKCGMNLTKNEAGAKCDSKKKSCCKEGDKKENKCKMKMSNEGGEAKDSYTCPMKCEGDKIYEKAGDCPKCGMHLKESKKEEKEEK